ncbi:MAG TPA: hypothetical protein VFA63_18370 [Pseudonocardiaceae bacterium]|nr:hypothetical protein [Pseudonocardiaceae bacterium]
MSDQHLTLSVACEVHDAPRHLIATQDRDHLTLDLHADECCAIRINRQSADALVKLLWNWLG